MVGAWFLNLLFLQLKRNYLHNLPKESAPTTRQRCLLTTSQQYEKLQTSTSLICSTNLILLCATSVVKTCTRNPIIPRSNILFNKLFVSSTNLISLKTLRHIKVKHLALPYADLKRNTLSNGHNHARGSISC